MQGWNIMSESDEQVNEDIWTRCRQPTDAELLVMRHVLQTGEQELSTHLFILCLQNLHLLVNKNWHPTIIKKLLSLDLEGNLEVRAQIAFTEDLGLIISMYTVGLTVKSSSRRSNIPFQSPWTPSIQIIKKQKQKNTKKPKPQNYQLQLEYNRTPQNTCSAITVGNTVDYGALVQITVTTALNPHLRYSNRTGKASKSLMLCFQGRIILIPYYIIKNRSNNFSPERNLPTFNSTNTRIVSGSI